MTEKMTKQPKKHEINKTKKYCFGPNICSSLHLFNSDVLISHLFFIYWVLWYWILGHRVFDFWDVRFWSNVPVSPNVTINTYFWFHKFYIKTSFTVLSIQIPDWSKTQNLIRLECSTLRIFCLSWFVKYIFLLSVFLRNFSGFGAYMGLCTIPKHGSFC